MFKKDVAKGLILALEWTSFEHEKKVKLMSLNMSCSSSVNILYLSVYNVSLI